MTKRFFLYLIPFVFGLLVSYVVHDLYTLNKFKNAGARYTYEDGVTDRAIRDKKDLELQTQIDELRTLCLLNERP